LKVQNILIKPLLKPKNTYDKPFFENTYYGENVKKCFKKIAQHVTTFLNNYFLPKKLLGLLNSSPNDKISPNLVTLNTKSPGCL
jgi:hypothetical protein